MCRMTISVYMVRGFLFGLVERHDLRERLGGKARAPTSAPSDVLASPSSRRWLSGFTSPFVEDRTGNRRAPHRSLNRPRRKAWTSCAWAGSAVSRPDRPDGLVRHEDAGRRGGGDLLNPPAIWASDPRERLARLPVAGSMSPTAKDGGRRAARAARTFRFTRLGPFPRILPPLEWPMMQWDRPGLLSASGRTPRR